MNESIKPRKGQAEGRGCLNLGERKHSRIQQTRMLNENQAYITGNTEVKQELKFKKKRASGTLE